MRQQPSQNCCRAAVPRTGSHVSSPTQVGEAGQARALKWPGLCLPAPPPVQRVMRRMVGQFCCHQEQEPVISASRAPQVPVYLLCGPGPHPLTHAIRYSCCRCFLSTYYVPGATDTERAIHSFIPFFLLSFVKHVSEQRCSNPPLCCGVKGLWGPRQKQGRARRYWPAPGGWCRVHTGLWVKAGKDGLDSRSV